ncbi:MAG: hydratase [Rhodanobacter sp.]|nr:MAG: hydratase [Rhodanobacter sp.]
MGLSGDQQTVASDLLYQTWRAGGVIEALPEPLRPATRREGYAIQALLERYTHAPLLGWKIAATSLAGQRHISVDAPLAGRLLAERTLESGAQHRLGANRMRVAEAEFAFRMARDLAPRPAPYTIDEVMGAVGALHLAIEIPDSRYAEFTRVGAPQLIADNACADWFVLGPEAQPKWRTIDLAAHRVSATLTGKPPIEGRGANVLGDPRLALAWLVNELSSLGIVVRAGQVVTTGTCVTPVAIAPGDILHADFGELGGVSVSFAT